MTTKKLESELKPTGETAPEQQTLDKPVCGIIMPISAINGYTPEHWSDVLGILNDAIDSAGFEPRLVSDSNDSGIIQKRIVQNIYTNDIIVCDVSAKNPNVMFELGMRLAFDKATVVIKDDDTTFSFDTSPIEHIGYPRDLRFNKINEFRGKLKDKIEGTYKMSKEDSNYSTFLKSFGEFTIPQLHTKEVPTDTYILQTMQELRNEITGLRRQVSSQSVSSTEPPRYFPMISVHSPVDKERQEVQEEVENAIIDYVKNNKTPTLPTYIEEEDQIEKYVISILSPKFKRLHSPIEIRRMIRGALVNSLSLQPWFNLNFVD